jgi:ABC-type sugar transport system substrate-binding protein
MKILIILLILNFSLFSSPIIIDRTHSKEIVFINPGKSNEVFWLNVSTFMKAAANDFGFNLKIIYAERNHFKMIKIMKDIVNQKIKPDFLIIVNENNMADKLLKISNNHKIKTMLILNDLSKEQKSVFGKPRGYFPYWIGSIIPDNIQAGYLVAKSLIKNSKNKKINMIAINGDESTFAARHRYIGLQKALKENPNVNFYQHFTADWREDISAQITQRALKRYPDTNVIWTANDPMAIGAIKTKNNKNILVSGLNWSQEALLAIQNDEMVASIGGHYMMGGWSIVLLYDYMHGKDFINESLELKQHIFSTIDKSNYKEYQKHFKNENFEQIDFTKFSKAKNNHINKYNFSLEKILGQLK